MIEVKRLSYRAGWSERRRDINFEVKPGITYLAHREYNTLSGGEQQRVQLARVIAQIADVPQGLLFLDGPINGLDMLYQ